MLVRVHLSGVGLSGVSEPMPRNQASAWARAAVAKFPGLQFELIRSLTGPLYTPTRATAREVDSRRARHLNWLGQAAPAESGPATGT